MTLNWMFWGALLTTVLGASVASAGAPAACGSRGDPEFSTGEVLGNEGTVGLWTGSCLGAAAELHSRTSDCFPGSILEGRVQVAVLDGPDCTTGLWVVL